MDVEVGVHDLSVEADGAALLDGKIARYQVHHRKVEIAAGERVVSLEAETAVLGVRVQLDGAVALGVERIAVHVQVDPQLGIRPHFQRHFQCVGRFGVLLGQAKHLFVVVHLVIVVLLHEGQEFPGTVRRPDAGGDVKVAFVGDGSVHVHGNALQRTLDTYLGIAENASVERRVNSLEQGKGVHPPHADPGIQANRLHLVGVEKHAAGNLSRSLHAVGKGHLAEMQAFVVQLQRTGHAVRNAEIIQLQGAVIYMKVLALDFQLADGTVQRQGTGEVSLELGEDRIQDVGGVADIQPVQVGVGVKGAVRRLHIAVQVYVPLSVQGVPEEENEAAFGTVPAACHLQASHRLPGNKGGVADDGGQQSRVRIGRRHHHGTPRGPSFEGRLTAGEGIHQADVEFFHPDG